MPGSSIEGHCCHTIDSTRDRRSIVDDPRAAILEDNASFYIFAKRVFSVANDFGLKALLEELHKIRQGPSGVELLQRLARVKDNYGRTLVKIAAEPDALPPISVVLSEEEFARVFAEAEAAAVAVCHFLVDEAGADVNDGGGGESPLYRATVCGCEPVAKFLLQRGANSASKVQALTSAAYVHDHSMLKILIENGADVVNNDAAYEGYGYGTTALTYAAQ